MDQKGERDKLTLSCAKVEVGESNLTQLGGSQIPLLQTPSKLDTHFSLGQCLYEPIPLSWDQGTLDDSK